MLEICDDSTQTNASSIYDFLFRIDNWINVVFSVRLSVKVTTVVLNPLSFTDKP